MKLWNVEDLADFCLEDDLDDFLLEDDLDELDELGKVDELDLGKLDLEKFNEEAAEKLEENVNSDYHQFDAELNRSEPGLGHQKQKKYQDSVEGLEENIENLKSKHYQAGLSKQEQGEGDMRQGCKQELQVEYKKKKMMKQ